MRGTTALSNMRVENTEEFFNRNHEMLKTLPKKKDTVYKPRDVEALLNQYHKLINAIYQQNKVKMNDQSKRDELYSYIVNTFILLVKEYDPSSNVDFPGYIKIKLTLRTKHSYLKKKFNDMDKQKVEDADDPKTDIALRLKESQNDVIKDLAYGNPLTEDICDNVLESFILQEMEQGNTSTKSIISVIRNTFPQISAAEIKEAISVLKQRLYERARELHFITE